MLSASVLTKHLLRSFKQVKTQLSNANGPARKKQFQRYSSGTTKNGPLENEMLFFRFHVYFSGVQVLTYVFLPMTHHSWLLSMIFHVALLTLNTSAVCTGDAGVSTY